MLPIKKQTTSSTTRDGTRLDADIYRPDTSENLPILLMRQPYGREIASTVVYAHPRWYAAQGYVVIIQDVRGRGTSEGNFQLFANEINDGEDTINWAAQLPGTTGEIGMYGFSYQGMTQLYAAANAPSSLKILCPSMLALDLYSDWAYENGAFCWQASLGWAIQLAAETARLKDDEAAFQKLYLASRNLPLSDKIPANPQVLRDLAPDSFYHDWITYSQPDDYWHNLSLKSFIDKIDLPMLHIGGWFDPYLRGTLNLYREMASGSAFPQHLIIGPWGHLPWNRAVGAKDYGQAAASPVDRLQLQWFDYFLKGKKSAALENSPVCLFEMGSNTWRYFEQFPENNQQDYYLISQNLANLREDDGNLVTAINEARESEDIIVHDPWRPVPALGGHASFPSGAFERSSIDCRSDVVTYTSEPLKSDLSLAGEVWLEIFCEASTPSFDLSAVLSEVHADGKVYNFTQGYIRVDLPQSPVRFTLQATCIKLTAGHSLRLSLSGACFPAYPVNPGTGQHPKMATLLEAKIITLSIACGGSHLSKIALPILSPDR